MRVSFGAVKVGTVVDNRLLIDCRSFDLKQTGSGLLADAPSAWQEVDHVGIKEMWGGAAAGKREVSWRRKRWSC